MTTKLTINMGSCPQLIDFNKPVWNVTDDELCQAVRDTGTYLGKPGSKYNPFVQWREAHNKAIQQAIKDGAEFSDKILYDKPGLIRLDLTPDQQDIACDLMVDVYRETKDYKQAVESYRAYIA